MVHSEHRLAACDGLHLFYRTWLPEAAPRAWIVVVHGICEHGGRYARLAESLCRRGYAVVIPDLRGHGRSDGPRLGIRRFRDYLDDLETLLAALANRTDGPAPQSAAPVFLLGHSMGGAVAAWLAIDRKAALGGLVLSAPAIRVAGNLFPVLRRLAWIASVLTPRLPLVRMGSSRLSRDPAVVADFRSDPLVFRGMFPVRTGAEVLEAGKRIQAAAARLTQPFLILHGTGDYVTDPGGSAQFCRQAASADKTLRLYPGLYHDLFHEPEHPQITADVLQWLDART